MTWSLHLLPNNTPIEAGHGLDLLNVEHVVNQFNLDLPCIPSAVCTRG